MGPSDATRMGSFLCCGLLMDYAMGVVYFLQLFFAHLCNLVNDAGIFGCAFHGVEVGVATL